MRTHQHSHMCAAAPLRLPGGAVAQLVFPELTHLSRCRLPCLDHGRERTWADPSHPAIHPPCSRAAHTRSKKASAPPAAIKFCIAWQFVGSGAASIPEPINRNFLPEQGGFLGCMFEAGTGPCGPRDLKFLHNTSILHPQAPRYGISRSRHWSLSCTHRAYMKSIHSGRVGRSGVGLGGAKCQKCVEI